MDPGDVGRPWVGRMDPTASPIHQELAVDIIQHAVEAGSLRQLKHKRARQTPTLAVDSRTG